MMARVSKSGGGGALKPLPVSQPHCSVTSAVDHQIRERALCISFRYLLGQQLYYSVQAGDGGRWDGTRRQRLSIDSKLEGRSL